MSTIIKEFTKEQLVEHLRTRIEHRKGLIASMHIDRGYRDYLKLELISSEIALASLEAEAVAYVDPIAFHNFSVYRSGETDNKRMGREWMWANPDAGLIPVYTAPPAPVSVPDDVLKGLLPDAEKAEFWFEHNGKILFEGVKFNNAVFDACRPAMLQGADTELQRKAAVHDALCQKYNVESLTDFVDWQRNHIAELEAAPPAPVGEGETAVMPDYPGHTMTQRECYQAGKKAGLAEAGSSPVIPDGWVACSERMPEDEQEVITHNIFGYRHISFFDEHSGLFFDRLDGSPVDSVEHVLVSHWMPLPAAPQQEVK